MPSRSPAVEYLAIYDAEDRPERDQLPRAVNAFRQGAPNLAVVQARLNIYNIADNWLTRQFTIEYSALFDGLLPSLERLGMPIPLGGTSNHFRVSALKWLMAWDPFNVTEDADLGIRLNRNGYRCGIIASTTYEEGTVQAHGVAEAARALAEGLFGDVACAYASAPHALARTRAARLCRISARDRRDGSLRARASGVLRAVSRRDSAWGLPECARHPARHSLLADGVVRPFKRLPRRDGGRVLSVRHRGYSELSAQILLMPLYWLLISVAAYRAV